ncbi:MAG: hypothetical protein LWY06_14720 [Firmicutes bacterium]|nr:hypothetical protein [Bacillota bacterium]
MINSGNSIQPLIYTEIKTNSDGYKTANDIEILPAASTQEDRFTAIKKLDEDLKNNKMPESLHEMANGSDLRHQKFLYGLKQAVQAGMSVVLGGCFATFFIPTIAPGNPGAVIAAGAGIMTAVNLFRNRGKFTGEVQIKMNDQSRNETFYNDPRIHRKSPQELRHILISKGILGEQEPAGKSMGVETPKNINREILETLKPHAETLRKLSSERRLVADFDQKTTYGNKMLNPVGSALAVQLIAAGKPVYIIDGTSTKTNGNYLQETGRSHNGKVKLSSLDQYTEATFNYNLKKVSSAKDLEEVNKDAKGMPAGFSYVLADSDHCTSITSRNGKSSFELTEERYAFLDGPGLDPSKPPEEMYNKHAEMEKQKNLEIRK